MAIFDEIGKKISQTTQSAVKGTKGLAETTRINMKISEEQKIVDSLIMQLGNRFYELHHDTADDNFSSLCMSISESLSKIENLKTEIQNIKGVRKCQNCGAEIPLTSVFCGTCGYNTCKGNATSEQTSQRTPLCSNCNQELADDAAFCTKCGQKV